MQIHETLLDQELFLRRRPRRLRGIDDFIPVGAGGGDTPIQHLLEEVRNGLPLGRRAAAPGRRAAGEEYTHRAVGLRHVTLPLVAEAQHIDVRIASKTRLRHVPDEWSRPIRGAPGDLTQPFRQRLAISGWHTIQLGQSGRSQGIVDLLPRTAARVVVLCSVASSAPTLST